MRASNSAPAASIQMNLLRFRTALECLALAVFIGLGVTIGISVWNIQKAWSAVPGQIDAARTDITGQIASARIGALLEVDRQVVGLRADLSRQVSGIRADLMPRLDTMISQTDARVGQALQIADSRLGEATGAIVGVRADLKPTLVATAALEAAIPPDDVAGVVRDSRFFLARAARTAGHVEQMSDRIEAAVPPAIATWQSIGINANGIAVNVNRLTKPRWYDRLVSYAGIGLAGYRNLNPATSVIAITGIMAGRK